jgi:hypothetical protein
MTLRWGSRLVIGCAAVSIGLHAGFYLSSEKGQFFRLIATTECVPMAIASWCVSKAFPMCFPTLRQVILFEALVPILSGIQGLLFGLGIDSFADFRLRNTSLTEISAS